MWRRPNRGKLRSARPAEISVQLSLPFIGGISSTWRPDDAERRAAWELYVELITRVTVEQLGPEHGILREALSSYYSVFATTRDILRRYGTAVAPRERQGEMTFGVLAIMIVNGILRPVLEEWHSELTDYEAQRPAGVSVRQHERAWDRAAELRGVLNRTRASLEDLARLLAEVAGSADLLVPLNLDDSENRRGGGRVSSGFLIVVRNRCAIDAAATLCESSLSVASHCLRGGGVSRPRSRAHIHGRSLRSGWTLLRNSAEQQGLTEKAAPPIALPQVTTRASRLPRNCAAESG